MYKEYVLTKIVSTLYQYTKTLTLYDGVVHGGCAVVNAEAGLPLLSKWRDGS